MTKTTKDGLEHYLDLRNDYIHTIESALTNVHVPNWPMGLVLELRAEALEEVLHRVWETRMSLGAPGSLEPRLPPAIVPLPKNLISPTRLGRKPRAPQGGLPAVSAGHTGARARKRAGDVHAKATITELCNDARSEPLRERQAEGH